MLPGRLRELDVLRAVAILIIIFTHVDIFLEGDYGLLTNDLVHSLLAPFGIGLFFFVSGMALSRRYRLMSSLDDARAFYTRRISRIYPLYLAAVVVSIGVFSIHSIPEAAGPYGLGDFIIYAAGAQSVLEPVIPFHHIPALWFIGTLLIFYLAFPFTVMKTGDARATAIRSALVFIMLIILSAVLGIFEEAVIRYYPIFASGVLADRLGIFYSRGGRAASRNLALLTLLASAALAASPFIVPVIMNYRLFIAYMDIMAIAFGIAAYLAAGVLTRGGGFSGAASFISAGSYPAYLFHIPFLLVLARLLHGWGGWMGGELADLTIVLIGLPLLFAACYGVQQLEEKLHMRCG